MDKKQKLEKLFNPAIKNILLSDFLAPEKVRRGLSAFLQVNTEKELLNKIGVDFYYLPCRDISQNECSLDYYHGFPLEMTEVSRYCPFGIKWQRKVGKDKFGVDEALSGPFSSENVTEKDILDFRWPSPSDFDFSSLANECDIFSDRIIVGGLWSAIQGDSSRMMGFGNFLMNIAFNRSLVKTLVNRVTDFYLEANSHYFDAVKGKMDIFFMGNDFGSQNGLLMSEEDWVDIYYDNYKKLIDLAHSYGFKVMVHSCGSIDPLIPFFIQLGVDILDPVQITSRNMEPGYLGLKYGKKIVFHGAVDTQKVLPFGTVLDVEAHCAELITSLNTSGNFVIAPSNNFLPGTPYINIMKVYETAEKFKNQL